MTLETAEQPDEEAIWFVSYFDGEKGVEQKLCHSITSYIVGYLTRSFGERVADDVLGDALEKIFIVQARKLYEQIKNREISSLRPFIKTVAKRLALDVIKSGHYKAHYRNSANEISYAQQGDDVDDPYNALSLEIKPADPFINLVDVDEPLDIIRSAIQELPSLQRAVVSYRLLDFKSTEVCELLNITIEQEKYAKKKGLAHVIARLVESGFTPDDFTPSPTTKSALTSIQKDFALDSDTESSEVKIDDKQ